MGRFPNYEHSIFTKADAISDRYTLWPAISKLKTTLAGVIGIAYESCPTCGSGIRGEGMRNAYYTCECGTTISAVRISLRTDGWIVTCFYVPIVNLTVEEDII